MFDHLPLPDISAVLPFRDMPRKIIGKWRNGEPQDERMRLMKCQDCGRLIDMQRC
jgi:hypothetical protein